MIHLAPRARPTQPLRCAYCHDADDGAETSTCGCGATFHLECRRQLGAGRCATPGCSALTRRTARTPVPRCGFCRMAGSVFVRCAVCGDEVHRGCRVQGRCRTCVARGTPRPTGLRWATEVDARRVAPPPSASIVPEFVHVLVDSLPAAAFGAVLFAPFGTFWPFLFSRTLSMGWSPELHDRMGRGMLLVGAIGGVVGLLLGLLGLRVPLDERRARRDHAR